MPPSTKPGKSTPPSINPNLFDTHIEEAVIGSLLIAPEYLPKVRTILGATADAFWMGTLKVVWLAFLEMHKQGLAIDLLTVESFLQSRQLLAKAGGSALLTKCIAIGGSEIAHVETYAQLIEDLWRRREMEAAGTSIFKLAHDMQQEVSQTQAKAMSAIMGVGSDSSGWQGIIPGSELPNMAFDIQARRKNGQTGLITGLAAIDNLISPIPGGNLVVLLAPTSAGKTTFMLQVIKANVLAGHRPMFFYNELDIDDLTDRLLIMESVDLADRSSWKVINGNSTPMPKLTDKELSKGNLDQDPRFMDAVDKLNKWIKDVIFIPCMGLKADEIAARAYQLWWQGLADQIYLDYMDLVPYDKSGNMAEEIGGKVAQLKNAGMACRRHAGDAGIPVWINCQPRKEPAPGTKLTMNDAFGSVRTSQYANYFWTLEPEYNGDVRTGFTKFMMLKGAKSGAEGKYVWLRTAGNATERGFLFYVMKRPTP